MDWQQFTDATADADRRAHESALAFVRGPDAFLDYMAGTLAEVQQRLGIQPGDDVEQPRTQPRSDGASGGTDRGSGTGT